MFNVFIDVLKAIDNLIRVITADQWFITIDGMEVKYYV